MKHILYLIVFYIIQFLYFFWEWKFLDYSYKEYVKAVESYYDDDAYYY
jgi:hypothetical protein